MRETANLEFKSELTRSFLKTVSAFANYGTGSIIFGVTDDGAAVGLANPHDTMLRIEHAINDSLDPVPSFTLEADESNHTVKLTVREGTAKPYLANGAAYRRADSSTIKVDRLEYNRLMLEGENTSFDALASKRQDLAFANLGRRLADKVGLPELDANALISLELMTSAGTYNNAAALLADANQFPGTDIARFGESINIILSRHTFDRRSLLAQLDDALTVFDEHYTYEEIMGMERIERHLIPQEAFREALANALVHRCWDVGAHIKVSMFEDRIEIDSPGALPQGITESQYLSGGPSVARNPILANVFFRLGYIERFGTGIPRIVNAYADSDVSPSFAVTESSIKVTLPAEQRLSFTLDEQAVLRALPKGTKRTRSAIESAAGLSKDKTIRILNSLMGKSQIEKTGSGRATTYSRI